jgi:hypothetical protein
VTVVAKAERAPLWLLVSMFAMYGDEERPITVGTGGVLVEVLCKPASRGTMRRELCERVGGAVDANPG